MAPTGIVWSPDAILASYAGRQGAAVAGETGSDLILVFGGSNASLGSKPLNTTLVVWLSNATSHEVPTPTGLSARAYASLAWDGAANPGRFVLFGGLSTFGTVFGDTWWFFPQNFTWVEVCAACGVPTRWGSTFEAEPGVNLLALYGGQGGGATLYLSDTWTYAIGGGWTNVTTASTPPALFDACAVALPGTGGLLMFGGALSNGGASAQTWELTWSSLHWAALDPASSPSGREACALTNTASGTSALLYGGINGTTYYGDAWVFDPSVPSWTDLGNQGPGPRAFATLLNWTARGVDSLWIYGGADASDAGFTSSFVGALLPAAAPVLGIPVISPAPPLLGSPVNITVAASVPGVLFLSQVNVTATYPGGGIVRGALLSLFSGTSSNGNWTTVLPAPSSAGTIGWTVSALDDAGTSVMQTGQAVVAPGPGRVQGFVYGETEVGGVPQAVPLAGVAVYANGTLSVNSTKTITGPSGSFRFSLSAGQYQVSANRSGYLGQVSAVVVAWSTTDSVDLILTAISAPTGTLQGFVYGLATVQGHPSETPLTDAVVTVTGLGPGNFTEVNTGTGGAYSIPLPVGTYTVNASAPGYPSVTNTTLILRGAASSLDFWLPSPSVQNGVDFVGNATVLGTTNPESLVGVEVWVNSSTHVSYPVQLTDENGSYAFNLEPGAYYFVNYTIPGYIAPSFYFHYPVGGYVVHHNANLTVTNPAVELLVTLTSAPSAPVTGTAVDVSITVVNAKGNPPTSGLVSLFLVGPANSSYAAITTAPGASLPASGILQVSFTVPQNITTPTVYELHAVVTAAGFAAKVAAEIPLTVSPLPPPTPTSTTTSWLTYGIVGALAVAVAALALFVVLRRNPPRVEEIFLVYKGGKLVWHASRTARADLEPEVVTGMLEAVEGFLQRSFTPEGGHLNVLEFANMKLHIVRGERLTAAALIGGRHPEETVREVQVALADMEKAWKASLEDWDGTAASLPHLRAYVEALLDGYYFRHGHLKTEAAEETKAAA